MAAPLLAAAAISGGTQLAGSALSAYSQGRMNKRAMRFQREMFDKTNAYNHPLAQRQRLEEAGLNPNLVYGGSPSGTAGEAKQPAQPDLKAVDYTAAGKSIGDTAQNYLSWRNIESGIKVNEERTENLKQDTINKGIDALNKAIRNSSDSLDYYTKARLFKTTVETAEERLRNLSVNTDYIGNKDAREQRITQETLKKIMQETSNLRTQGKVLSEEALMRKIDNELYTKYRIRPQDPFYMRILHNIMEELGLNPFKN